MKIVGTVGVLKPGTLEGLFLFPATGPVLIVQIHCSDITSHSNTNLYNSVFNLKVMIFCKKKITLRLRSHSYNIIFTPENYSSIMTEKIASS
jgi:hypothetical protein